MHRTHSIAGPSSPAGALVLVSSVRVHEDDAFYIHLDSSRIQMKKVERRPVVSVCVRKEPSDCANASMHAHVIAIPRYEADKRPSYSFSLEKNSTSQRERGGIVVGGGAARWSHSNARACNCWLCSQLPVDRLSVLNRLRELRLGRLRVLRLPVWRLCVLRRISGRWWLRVHRLRRLRESRVLLRLRLRCDDDRLLHDGGRHLCLHHHHGWSVVASTPTGDDAREDEETADAADDGAD